ncbi:hypothetical protein AAY473_035198 [Plecturocebus cupreus]
MGISGRASSTRVYTLPPSVHIQSTFPALSNRTTGFHHVGQAGLQLPTSGDPPTLASKHFGRQRRVDHLRSGVLDQAGQHGKTLSLVKKKKNTKTSQVWWQAPLIPATQEAEAGESFERGRQRMQILLPHIVRSLLSETLSQFPTTPSVDPTLTRWMNLGSLPEPQSSWLQNGKNTAYLKELQRGFYAKTVPAMKHGRRSVEEFGAVGQVDTGASLCDKLYGRGCTSAGPEAAHGMESQGLLCTEKTQLKEHWNKQPSEGGKFRSSCLLPATVHGTQAVQAEGNPRASAKLLSALPWPPSHVSQQPKSEGGQDGRGLPNTAFPSSTEH